MHDDVLYNVFAFLPLESLLKVSLVSKNWNKLSKSPHLYTPALLASGFDFTEKKNPCYLFKEWRDPQCFWEKEEAEQYIMKKVPIPLQCGITVFQSQMDFFKSQKAIDKDRFIKMYDDMELAAELKTLFHEEIRHHTESDFEYQPFIIFCEEKVKEPWKKVIELLETNPILKTSFPGSKGEDPLKHFWEDLEDNHEEEEEEIEEIKEIMLENLENLRFVHVGAEQCLPFVVMIIGNTKNGNIVGLLSGGVWT